MCKYYREMSAFVKHVGYMKRCWTKIKSILPVKFWNQLYKTS